MRALLFLLGWFAVAAVVAPFVGSALRLAGAGMDRVDAEAGDA